MNFNQIYYYINIILIIMNINLLYKGKDYNFDIPNDATVDYIKELSSKLINLDKESVDLFFNNEKINKNYNKTLIENLIPKGENSTMVTLEINNLNKIHNKSLKSKEENPNGVLLNKSNNLQKINDKIGQINNKIYENYDSFFIKKFELKYIKNNNILLSIMKEFFNKIKQIYLNIFHEYLISLRNEDSTTDINKSEFYQKNPYLTELILFEKKINGFQVNQINYYLKLLEFIKKNDNKEIILKLNELYTKLLVYNCFTDKESNKELINPLKFKKKSIHKKNNSTINNLISKNAKKELPILNIKNNSSLYEENNNYNSLNNEKILLKKERNSNSIETEQKNSIKENTFKINDKMINSNSINEKSIYNRKNSYENKEEKNEIFNINDKNNINKNKCDENNIKFPVYQRLNSINYSIRKNINEEERNQNDNQKINENIYQNILKNENNTSKVNKKELKDINGYSLKINYSNLVKNNLSISKNKKKKSFSKFDFFI